jgi:cell wall-associated NlpC family hydrolase
MTTPRPLAGNSWRPGNGSNGNNSGPSVAGANNLQQSIDALTRAVNGLNQNVNRGTGGGGGTPPPTPNGGGPGGPLPGAQNNGRGNGGNPTFGGRSPGDGLFSGQRAQSAVREGAAGYLNAGWRGIGTGAVQGYSTSGGRNGGNTVISGVGTTMRNTMNSLSSYGATHQDRYVEWDYYAQMTQMRNGNRNGGTTTYHQNLTDIGGSVGSGARFLGARDDEDLLNSGFSAQNLGFTQTDPRWRQNMGQYSAMSMMNPNLSMQQAAQYQQTLGTRGNFWQMQMMGLGTNLNTDGSAKSTLNLTGQVIRNQLIDPNRKLTADDVAKMTSNTSNLRQTMTRMGVSADQFDNIVTPYLSGLSAAQQHGMSQQEYETMYEKAGQGDKDALGALKKAGVATDTVLQSQKNVNATARTRTAELTDDFAGGMKKAAEGLDKFNTFMNQFLKIPGVQKIVGNTSGFMSLFNENSSLPGGSMIGGLLNRLGGASGAGSATQGSSAGSGATGSSGGQTAAGAAQVAMKYLGKPYQWGGSNPSTSFDCSGLMQWAYGQIGINLPRVSQDQEHSGKEVPKNQRRVGDLILFGEPAHHVGMSIGDGKMIEAPHTGANIRISDDRIGSASHVRRILDTAGVLSQTGQSDTGKSDTVTQNGAAKAGPGGNIGGGPVSLEEIDAIRNVLGSSPSANLGVGGGTTGTQNNAQDVAQSGSMPALAAGLTGSSSQNRALALKMASQMMGWNGAQAEAVGWIGDHESGFRVNADNPTSDAYGIPQALPGSKMSSEGPDWKTNPSTQIRWMLKYIKGRYKDPLTAKKFWETHNWYESGTGTLGASGDQLARLHDGEIVLNRQQSDTVRAVLRSGFGDDKAFPKGDSPAVNRNPSATFMSDHAAQAMGAVTLKFEPGSVVFQMSQPMSEVDARKAARTFVDAVQKDSRIKNLARV